MVMKMMIHLLKCFTSLTVTFLLPVGWNSVACCLISPYQKPVTHIIEQHVIHNCTKDAIGGHDQTASLVFRDDHRLRPHQHGQQLDTYQCSIPDLPNAKVFLEGNEIFSGTLIDVGQQVVLICNRGYQNSPTAEYDCIAKEFWEPALEDCSSYQNQKDFKSNVGYWQNRDPLLDENYFESNDKREKPSSQKITTSTVTATTKAHTIRNFHDRGHHKPTAVHSDPVSDYYYHHQDDDENGQSVSPKTTEPATTSRPFDPSLGVAITQGRIKNVRKILNKGIDINANRYNDGDCGWGSKQQTPLMVAVSCNSSISLVKLLIEYGADVNAVDEYGQTVLNSAAWLSPPEIVQELLKNGADANKAAGDGMTPLIWAVKRENLRTVHQILLHGGDPNMKDVDGWTALIEASNKTRPDLVEILLQNGADPNAVTNDKYTSLIYASSRGDIETVKLLVNKGADINMKAGDESTALIWAVLSGDKASVRFLLSCGADINEQDSEGYTALQWAVTHSMENIVKILFIRKEIDLDAGDNDGVTPLMVAVKVNNQEMVKLLLARGADVNARDNDGWTALAYASSFGNSSIVPVMNTLIENGADINSQDNEGNTPLMYSLEYRSIGGDMTVFLLLLEKGADINLKTHHGTTLLMIASRAGLTGLVNILIDKGADVNAKNDNGNTALIMAAANNKHDVLKTLRKHGASRLGCMYYICSTA